MIKDNFEKGWYVIYTKPRHESKVTKQLSNNINTYLPLTKSLRKWSDRKKWVEKPLFTSYVFVYLQNLFHYNLVLQTSGVCWFLTEHGKPFRIKDEEVERIRYMLNKGSEFKIIPSDYVLNVGDLKRIKTGPLKGMKCKIVRYEGKDRAFVRIDSLNQSIIGDIPIRMFEYDKEVELVV